jgi:hypothetical protein
MVIPQKYPQSTLAEGKNEGDMQKGTSKAFYHMYSIYPTTMA